MDEPAPLIDRLDRLRGQIDAAQREATRATETADARLTAQRTKISAARSAEQRDNARWRDANVRPLVAQAHEALGSRVHLWERAEQQRHAPRRPPASMDTLDLPDTLDLLAEAANKLGSIWRSRRYWVAMAVAAVRRADQLIADSDAQAERQARLAGQQAVDDHHQAITAARRRWQAQFARLRAELAATVAELDEIDRPADTDWSDWRTPARPLGAVRLGDHTRQGFADEPIAVPALFRFPAATNLVIRTVRDNAEHTDAILGVICRLLAAVPPGQLRLTVIDPRSLGGSVRTLAGLNSDDVKLLDKPLTESIDIERRLAALVGRIMRVHGEMLGPNGLDTLTEYNDRVAARPEPYHLVVLFDFPSGFTTADSRIRVDQVMSNGPACGVYTVLAINDEDPDHQHHLELTADGRVLPGPAAFGPASAGAWGLELARPREGRWERSAALRTVVERVADAARDAGLVVVSVERMFALLPATARPEHGGVPGATTAISPQEPATWWQGDAGGLLVAPLGLYGLDDVQALRLGEDTWQHALIAGTTGSGKSTLLHTLIISAATVYSPDELELYLIDLKGGVEFSEYAVRRLPHARVVSMHSEREFGLETMQGLLAESRRRELLFAQHGVQDLADYRRAWDAAPADDPLRAEPRFARALLIIDEYHVLFEGDDHIARAARACLSSLVRQGRAFGIGTLMASQTPSSPVQLGEGVPSQMAVRIALRCPENISRRILAENNVAASLLTARGEAIYNPEYGQVGRDTTFQVAFQDRLARADALDRMSRLAHARGFTREPMVYDGHRPGDLTRDGVFEAHAGAEYRRAGRGPTDPVRVWLGEPMGLTAPVSVAFSASPRRSLLAIGDDEANVGVLVAVVTALAAAGLGRTAATADAVTVIDFTGAASHSRYPGVQAELEVLLPGLRRIAVRDAEEHLVALADEVRRRLADDAFPAGRAQDARFVLLNGLRPAQGLADSPRFRPAGLGMALDVLLSQGSEVGVFVVATMDPSAERRIHSEYLNEFGPVLTRWQPHTYDHRIQSLVGRRTDSLRDGQALLIDEDTEARLRPYQIPRPGWLTELAARLPAGDAPSTELPTV
ncbi:FtsK/SpoIIIE domain-containing protein [Frankia sp. AgB32]|uniref:FtsK/SpoIIIE domain-containing protein n=1 Tax=Frankia sp. AgB32 TaxID=631119 RepID=UPI00200BF9D8|nr:FtsK/SpoIIIE domain-containing protein [Frankia sp. AgB32]MCK9895298.1 DNA translocase FtsK [Frankia sp. AgB32]